MVEPANRARCLRPVGSLLFATAVVLAGRGAPARADTDFDRTTALRGCLATYNAPPRSADGRIDGGCLLAEIAGLGAMVSCHQNPKSQTAKYAVVRRAFATPVSP